MEMRIQHVIVVLVLMLQTTWTLSILTPSSIFCRAGSPPSARANFPTCHNVSARGVLVGTTDEDNILVPRSLNLNVIVCGSAKARTCQWNLSHLSALPQLTKPMTASPL